MRHKTALVTGGTAGVGLSIVRALASSGVEVHFIGTSEEKGRRVEQELNESSDTVCRFIKLDLSSLHDTRDFDKTLEFTENYKGMQVAIDTVHAKAVLTEVYADKLASQGIDVNVFHPGWVKSDMARSMSFPMSAVFKVGNVFMSNTSKTGIYLSTSDDVEGLTGQFFVRKKPRPLSFDQAYKDRLWNATEEMIEQALTSPTTPT